MRRRDGLPDTGITGMDNQHQDDTEDRVQQRRHYEVHQSANGDHTVHPGVQTGRAWKQRRTHTHTYIRESEKSERNIPAGPHDRLCGIFMRARTLSKNLT